MDNKPEFSIIMGAYNAEKTLEKAIESVVSQKYINWELIIIDDGSNDATFDIGKEYERRDYRVKLIKQSNQGVSTARNVGINLAEGEYIVFLDADDFLMSECLNIYKKIIIETEPDLIISNNYIQDRYVQHSRKITKKTVNSDEEKALLMEVALSQSQYHGQEWYGNLHTVWAKCFSSNILKRNNLTFDERLKVGEDILFFLNFVLNCKDIKLTNEPTYIYTINPDSVMHTITWNGPESGKLLFQSVEQLVSNIISEQVLLDFWTEIAENDWYNILRSNLSVKNQHYIFSNLMLENSYIRFSDGRLKKYMSKKQKIYFDLIRKKAAWSLMTFVYFRMKKNRIRDKFNVQKNKSVDELHDMITTKTKK